jgi:hypothetical protein
MDCNSLLVSVSMRYLGNPLDLQIAPDVLLRVPESVAVENKILPLRTHDGYLEVIASNSLTDGELEDVRDRVGFILNLEKLNLELRILLTDFRDLDHAIAYHYRQHLGKVVRCGLNVAFQCNKGWLELKSTTDPCTRYCEQCQKCVYLCESEAEIESHATQGHCVAFYTQEKDTWMGLRIFEDDGSQNASGN